MHMMQEEETEKLKAKIIRKRMRSKPKLVLRLKRWTLQMMELTSKESQAFSTLIAQALLYISSSEVADKLIQLS